MMQIECPSGRSTRGSSSKNTDEPGQVDPSQCGWPLRGDPDGETEVVMLTLPTAQDLQAKIAQAEGERASAAMRAHAAAEAEKQAFLDRVGKPSGFSDEQLVEKAAYIINRAVENGLTSVQVFKFPNHLCNDDGRAIDQNELGWERTLTGIPKEIHQFWERRLKAGGYHLKYAVIDRPGGMRGDIGVFLSWG
jgi:hypothetical protein